MRLSLGKTAVGPEAEKAEARHQSGAWGRVLEAPIRQSAGDPATRALLYTSSGRG